MSGKKRQHTSSKGAIHEKRQKTRSLMTVDILDMVTAVVQSLPQSGAVTLAPAQGNRCTIRTASHGMSRNIDKSSQTSRHQGRSNREVSSHCPDSSNHKVSSCHQDSSNCAVSPNSESGDDGDEDTDNEEFGKINHIQCGNVV